MSDSQSQGVGGLRRAYRREGLSPDQIDAEVKKAWGELKSNAKFREQAKREGFDVDQVEQELRAQGKDLAALVRVEPGPSGFTGAETVLVLLIPVAQQLLGEALVRVWDRVLVPWIQSRRGGNELNPADEAGGSGATKR